jgi:hypothetical protein
MKEPDKKNASLKALMKEEQLDKNQQKLIMDQLAESPDLIRDFDFILYLIQNIKLAKDREEESVTKNWDSYTKRIQRYKTKKIFYKFLNTAAIFVLIFFASLFYIYEGFGLFNVLFNGELSAVRKRQYEDADLLLVCNKDTLPLVNGDDFFAVDGIRITYNLSGNGLALSHLTPKNKNSKIIVITPVGKTAKIIIQGTIFYLKAYHDENDIIATLVRGSIGFNLLEGEEQKMKPGEQFVFYKSENKFVTHNVDTRIAFSWKDGIVLFK